MTEEELKEKMDKDFDEILNVKSIMNFQYDLLQKAYLKGLKAGKPKWRKVADGNYPLCEKGYYTVNVLTNYGDIAYYDYNDDCWVVEPSSAEIDPPIAWCEIPKYTEE